MKSQADPIGRNLAGYEILGELGAGGMGVVYKARHLRLERLVALKLLPADKAVDEAHRRRFLQEARAASALNHPGIVTIHDIVAHGGADLLVMEIVEGRSLAEHIPPDGLPWREAVGLALQISEAMAVAHAAGILHRDLKPSNVMVLPDARIKVLDFGIAKLLPRGGATDDAHHASAQLTAPGTQPGTPAYMAPEQLLGEALDPRADIFSLGVLLFEMLTGRRPFRGRNMVALVDEILHGNLPSLRGLRPEVPSALAAVVDKALAKQPAKRFASMDDLAAALCALRVPTTVPGEIAEGISLKTLLVRDLVESTVLMDDAVAGSEDLDQRLQELEGGVLEDSVLKHRDHGRRLAAQDGGLLLFDLPWDAVRFALAFHRIVAEHEQATGSKIETCVAIHLGEVTVGREISAPGTPTFAVDPAARAVASRLLSLTSSRQTLLTNAAFDLARRGARRDDTDVERLSWLAHGAYHFREEHCGEERDADEAIDLFEVGVEGLAPLRPPEGTRSAARATLQHIVLGWRPAPGLTIPRRPHWTVERKLGEGGFGEVWLGAHAKTHERRVFKFCYEVERLRSLQREITVFRLLKEELGERDDIARLIDWNLDDPPYFLESAYSDGGSLVDWSAERGGLADVALAERLELIAQVATALEAAHSVGVLHKDVKPANVLIARGTEGRPRAVLTDFGIGSITNRERLMARGITVLGLTEDGSTGDGSAPSGTPLYMAPELLVGRSPTIQSDLYALGVMLYQVVVGDLDRPLAPGWERDVDDELLREDIAAFADGRPRHRPRSALEVAERLRHLDARRTAREAERQALRDAQKNARRRRLLGIAAVVATVFLVVVGVFALQAVRARADAERQRTQAERLIDVLLGDLHESLEKIGRLDLLEQAARGTQAYFDSLDERDEPGAETLKRGVTLLNIGDVLLRGGDTKAAHASYAAALNLFDSAVARNPEDLELLDGRRRCRVKLGWALSRQGETAAALETLHNALDDAERLGAGLAETRFWICVLEEQRGNREQALATCRAALENLGFDTAISADDLRKIPWRQALLMLDTTILVGGILRELQQGGAALAELQKARSLATRLVQEDPGNTYWPRKLAWIQFQTGHLRLFQLKDLDGARADLEAARSTYRQLSVTDPAQARWRDSLAEILNFLGRIDLQQGKIQAAMELFTEAAGILERLVEEDPSRRSRLGLLARVDQSIGRAHSELGDTIAAIASFEAAVDLNTRLAAVAGDDPDPQNLLSWSRVVLGDGYAQHGDIERAREEWTRAVEIIAPITASSNAPGYQDTHAQALLKLGRVDEATPLVEALLAAGWDDPGFLELVRRTKLERLIP